MWLCVGIIVLAIQAVQVRAQDVAQVNGIGSQSRKQNIYLVQVDSLSPSQSKELAEDWSKM